MASVEWDADGHTNVYRYGEGGAFDLLLVDEPRILSKFETIAVGCCVKRGKISDPNLSRIVTKPRKWHVRPAKIHIRPV